MKTSLKTPTETESQSENPDCFPFDKCLQCMMTIGHMTKNTGGTVNIAISERNPSKAAILRRTLSRSWRQALRHLCAIQSVIQWSDQNSYVYWSRGICDFGVDERRSDGRTKKKNGEGVLPPVNILLTLN